MSDLTPPVTAALAPLFAERAADRVDQVVADAIRLMRVESPSHDIAAVARSATAVAELIEARLGVTPERIEIEGVTHLRVHFGSETRVVLVTHHDTVWPVGTLDRLPAQVADGKLTGPGAVDMKTGIALAVHALELLREADVSLDGVTLLVTGDEEVGSTHSRALIEETARGARAALVFEAGGDGGELKAERKGASMYRFTVHGVAAHAGLAPDDGVNAAVGAATLITQIASLHRSEPGLSVVPSVVHAGTTTNTVPALAMVDVDVRVTSAASQQRIDERLRALAAELPLALPGASVEVAGGTNRAPMEGRLSAELVALTQRVCTTVGIPDPGAIAVGGASDGNFTAGIGVPTLDGLGAYGGGAHAETEHAVVAGLGDRLALAAGLIDALLADEAVPENDTLPAGEPANDTQGGAA